MLRDLDRYPILALALLFAAFLSLVYAGRRMEASASAGWILGIAALTRLLLLPLPPSLSDDMLRYLWDGKVLTHGENPYLLAPEAPELAPLRDEIWQRMPHKEVATVYPPLALGLFSISSWLPAPFLSLKILLSLADLLACWWLLKLAQALGLPRGRAIWYAWNPLVCLETAGMGHVDALMAAAMVIAVGLLVRAPQRPVATATAAVAGDLAKLVPLVALPLWARSSKRPWLFLIACIAFLFLAFLPVFISTSGVPPGLVTYGVSWEFNGPLYEPLWRFIDHQDWATSAKSWLDQKKLETGEHEAWNRYYRFMYPQLMAKVTLLVLFALLWLLAWRHSNPVVASGRVFGAVLLCSATFYPWYLLWVLPWAALSRNKAWLTLSATVLLCYLPQTTELTLFPWVYAAIWLPFFLLLPWSRWSTA